jgi:lipoprotein-releasing system ATP-binding protein
MNPTPSSAGVPPDGADAFVEAIGAHKAYRIGRREIEVLRGASVAVRRGEKLAVVGASGSGKSTLLNVLSGLDRPSAGSVRIDGRDLYGMSAHDRTALRARRIGFVFQAYHLFPELTLFDNVLLPARVRWNGFGGDRAARRRAEGLIERVGLSARAGHRPDELSGGEQQRVAIARALMRDPDILFADEPTGNLDSESGEIVLSCLFELMGGRERTVVLVTHNPDIAARCDRMLTLRDGVIG